LVRKWSFSAQKQKLQMYPFLHGCTTDRLIIEIKDRHYFT
jgi:hypothetical protein